MTAKRCPSCDVELHEDGSATFKGPAPKSGEPPAGAGEPPPASTTAPAAAAPPAAPAQAPKAFETLFDELAGGDA